MRRYRTVREVSCCSRGGNTHRNISNHGSYDWALPPSKEEIEAWEKLLVSLGARRVDMSTIELKHELVEAKPMDLPSGLVFYLDYKYNKEQ